MSGGYFDYVQYRISDIVDEVEKIIRENPYEYPEEVLAKLRKGVIVLKTAEVYTERIDWLISGDDNEATFLERLEKELKELK